MKPSYFFALLSAAAPALADFYIHKGGLEVHFDPNASIDYPQWYITNRKDIADTCDKDKFKDDKDAAVNVFGYKPRSDVSGRKIGIACDGRGCSDSDLPTEIERLELNVHFAHRFGIVSHLSTFPPYPSPLLQGQVRR
jgi:hypothetical protein